MQSNVIRVCKLIKQVEIDVLVIPWARLESDSWRRNQNWTMAIPKWGRGSQTGALQVVKSNSKGAITT